VGNNIPVFFIQDAMKFPDLVHAVKPEPHHGMPQAASAHDTFWDFASLMPETTHMLMWVMSDRGIPRSYRMMQGFGVHTFRLVNAEGESHFVKFHWKPKLGTHSLVWDEAVKIAGADPDFHRRDLWEAIEAASTPSGSWACRSSPRTGRGLQLRRARRHQADSRRTGAGAPVGRMVLNRNPDNFFAETEQVAFCTAHVVPGIDFSNDPLLAGRIHSYIDTQITRLGGPNFHEIPINAPLAPVHNNQRDGMHRQAIPAAASPTSPTRWAAAARSRPAPRASCRFPQPWDPGDKLRGKPEKFADHYTQATLFYDSQTAVEQAHIVGGFRFELSKLTVPAIRERMLSSLVNVSPNWPRWRSTGSLLAEHDQTHGLRDQPVSPRQDHPGPGRRQRTCSKGRYLPTPWRRASSIRASCWYATLRMLRPASLPPLASTGTRHDRQHGCQPEQRSGCGSDEC
jgi:catalase